MREYLSLSNLRRALPVAGAVTMLSIPRILQGNLPVVLYTIAAFLSLILLSGAATAWGRKGGMAGLFPERRRMLFGVMLGAGLAVLVLPLYLAWVDPALHRAVTAAENPEVLRLRYPATTGGRFALVLWTAGFEIMFFQAFLMSFAARLTGRQSIAIACSVALRLYVTHLGLMEAGVSGEYPLFMTSAGVSALACAVLFARFGFPASAVFSAGTSLHVFFI
ncbi:MAG: hypothetical protein R6V03_03035 [Kiritimatiellia bacterium]